MSNKSKLAVAAELLRIKAVKLQPEQPFTWASGWKSPFYCDNRKTLSFPELRTRVKLGLANLILNEFPEADIVAGVATGAIAQGALVAEELGKPFVYVRPKAKDHGMGNQIEGDVYPGAKVVVVEDLVSTGLSSLRAVDALRAAGVEVVGMVASFTYGFSVATEAFENAGVKLITLTDYEAVLEAAKATGYISENGLMGTWYAKLTNGSIKGDVMAPIADGLIQITVTGNAISINISSSDDAGNKIEGSISGTYTEKVTE